jgi:mannose-6-phosphate isomerase-like protein (cupin superfamily)
MGKVIGRRLVLALGLLVVYLASTSLAHYVIFPEGPADMSDLPRQGVTVVNKGIRSRFVYRRTSVETGGRVFEWDNYVDPGGGPMDIPHVHPDTREIFEVVDGEIEFVVDGRVQVVRAGSTIVAAPGQTHAFRNASGRPAHMISRIEAADEQPWAALAEKGLLLDSAYVQFDRAGGLGRLSNLQGLAFLSRFRTIGYRSDAPIWVQKTLAFLVAPTARLFGIHGYYPPPASSHTEDK